MLKPYKSNQFKKDKFKGKYKPYKKYNQYTFNFPKNIFYIRMTPHNLIITVTNLTGNIISYASAGSTGFKNTQKKNPFAAQKTTEKVLKNISSKEYQKRIALIIKGQGRGREAIIKAIQNAKLKITSIKDISPISYNGCRPPKYRRRRRRRYY
uniref:30S ribosomal protein S11 n=1 Tax=Nitzschia alba TaxID=2858 RepID=A0A5C0F3F0_NITAL|nr:30S ribosomal protein S11 [Nitzschia alba]QEI59603.1 30S ribosomal protein S11 [Nitzschia alba]